MPTQSIFIKNMVLDANVGIHDHEKKGPQPVRISVTVDVEDFQLHLNDDIRNTLSYSDIRKIIRSSIMNQHYHLVETLAEVIAKDVLSLPHALRVAVTIEKLKVYDQTESVGVTITRP